MVDLLAHPPVRQYGVDLLNSQSDSGHGARYGEFFIYPLVAIFKVAGNTGATTTMQALSEGSQPRPFISSSHRMQSVR